MNVSELARQLHINPPQKLLQILPEFGFDIGARAVKIDDRVAGQIKREWRRIKFILQKREEEEREQERQKERAARREAGTKVSIPAVLTVRELSERLQLPLNRLIVELMKNGILTAQNENIDHDTAVLIAQDLGFTITEETTAPGTAAVSTEHVAALEEALAAGATTPRPPVVVVMGHVDHGKTKLLDAIRSAQVAAGEAGGITQHIGAYQTIWVNPKTKTHSALTFIDTPGHEAFTVMRSRGAKVADIAILVVAADDSVKPQTVEAINIIKAAKLPVVVAINKIDKAGADAQRVRTDLTQHQIVPQEWGGDVPMVEISAKENRNIDQLLDTLLILADLHGEEIKANPARPAAGTVIEAHVDRGAGPVATILVQTGTLRVNDPLIINGEIYGKARALKNYRGEEVREAPPSTPVQIVGFRIAPQVGDVLDVGRAASAKAVDVRTKRAEQTGAERPALTLETTEEEGRKVLNLVIKADTLGSLEAIVGSLGNLRHPEVGVKVVGKGLGNISEGDVGRAQTAGGMILGFNVTATPLAQEMLGTSGVPFHQFSIIYRLIDLVKAELEKLLNPEVVVSELGRATVRQLFRFGKSTQIVGVVVEDGKLIPEAKLRVKRGGQEIGAGRLGALQAGKQAVKEVPAGSECGVQFEGKIKLEVGDTLEAYSEATKEKKLVLT
ncbi:MAG: translation initiation factor IF-2 [Candidatus Magasanikbacteria bacterium]|nr:translation initiation factor IF-2 [Candidatus Magasanikbacteria bacterium]